MAYHRGMLRRLPLALPVVLVCACTEPPSLDDARGTFEDALFDHLTCDEIARPSTLERLRALINEPTTDEAIALLTAPEDLASLVSLAGPQVEVTVIAIQNVHLAATSGLGQELLDGGFDGLTCDDVVPIACTAGTASSTVLCDDGVSVSGLTQGFDGCVLRGALMDGALTFSRQADGSARLAGETFSLDEVRALEGGLVLAVGDGTFAATDDDGVAFVDFGGPESGLSCGERLSLTTASLSVDGSAVRVELDGSHATPDGATALRTKGAHVRVADPLVCPCPDDGSVLEVTLPRVGGTDADGVLEVRWAGAGEEGACRGVTVAALSWPSTCTGFGDGCGQGAFESTMASMLGAFCIAP